MEDKANTNENTNHHLPAVEGQSDANGSASTSHSAYSSLQTDTTYHSVPDNLPDSSTPNYQAENNFQDDMKSTLPILSVENRPEKQQNRNTLPKQKSPDLTIYEDGLLIPVWVKTLLDKGHAIDRDMRRALVTVNCQQIWLNTQYPSSATKDALATLIVNRFDELRSEKGPFAVSLFTLHTVHVIHFSSESNFSQPRSC